MLKPHVALALIATICYALNGVITERYSGRLHVLWMLVLNNSFMLLISFAAIGVHVLAKKPPSMKLELSTFFLMSTIAGTVLFAANYAFYQAFQEGGTLPEIATILCLLPIFSTVIRMFFVPTGEESYALPSWQTIVGSSLIIAGILFIAFQSKPPK